MLRGNAATLTLAAVTVAVLTMSVVGFSEARESHSAIHINGDQELRSNACTCLENPNAAGTATDPFIISGWRIDTNHDPGIVVRDIDDTYFEIRNNGINAPDGIKLIDTGDRGDVYNNDIDFENRGIDLQNTAAVVAGNGVHAQSYQYKHAGTVGVYVEGGSPAIRGNHITDAHNGIFATGASPTLVENKLVEHRNGVELKSAASAELRDNTIRLSSQWAVFLHSSTEADLTGNELRGGQGGIIADGASGLYLEANTISNMDSDAVHFSRTDVTMFRNEVSHNWRGAVGSQTSDLTIRENVFENNGDDAINLEDTRGTVAENRLDRNEGTAIALDHTIVELRDNELYNNTFGFSIPYESRQSIDRMSGNVVNGVNVDGTENPDEQRLFYKEGSVTLDGVTVDSGGSAYYGMNTRQGAFVVYDGTRISVTNSTFEGQFNPDPSTGTGTAVYIRSAFDATLQNNTFSNNEQAVVAIDARVFIKDNVCEIDIDPDETLCFGIQGGFAGVRGNVIAHPAVGIRFNASANAEATGVIEDNTIRATSEVGIDLESDASLAVDDVEVLDNDLEANAKGMVMADFHGYVENNVVGNSTGPGVVVRGDSNATFVANVIVQNKVGVTEPDRCEDPRWPDCGYGIFVDNRIRANAETGVRLHGGTFEGDVIADNEVGVRLHGDAVLEDVELRGNGEAGLRSDAAVRLEGAHVHGNENVGVHVEGALRAEDVNASANLGTGIFVEGHAKIEGSVLKNNTEDGARLLGRAGVSETNASLNGEAGLRLEGTLFVVTDCEVSKNVNGVVMTDVLVNLAPDLRIEIEPPEVEPPDPTAPEPDDGEDDRDPLFMHDCDLVSNDEYALRATTTTVVNATLNFWGNDDGPRYDLPLTRGSNVVSDNVVASPYWQSRAHEQAGFVPQTEAEATGQARP
jgi:hypothetical protein